MATQAEVRRCVTRKKQKAVDAFGGECQICGYNKCLGALEFHHRDGEEKLVAPSYAVNKWSWERAKVELDKCTLLCANCHREVHEDLIDVSLQAPKRPFITRECMRCKEDFDTKDYDRKYCSAECSGLSHRKVIRPSKCELARLLKNTPYTQIGKMFGVSDNAVRKWAKKYALIT